MKFLDNIDINGESIKFALSVLGSLAFFAYFGIELFL